MIVLKNKETPDRIQDKDMVINFIIHLRLGYQTVLRDQLNLMKTCAPSKRMWRASGNCVTKDLCGNCFSLLCECTIINVPSHVGKHLSLMFGTSNKQQNDKSHVKLGENGASCQHKKYSHVDINNPGPSCFGAYDHIMWGAHKIWIISYITCVTFLYHAVVHYNCWLPTTQQAIFIILWN